MNMPVEITDHIAVEIKTGLSRSADILLSLVGLIFAAPLIALSALAIRITSSGPAFFRQTRMGRYGRTFTLYKLRTMKITNSGPQVTSGDDSRITSVGKILRKTKIDELPELWNVLKGDMSLIGPRPEVPRYVNTDDLRWQFVLSARPGITDPITLLLRNEETLLSKVDGDHEHFYLEVLQPYKLNGYVAYLENRSFVYDLSILFKTALAVVFSKKAPPPTIKEIISSNENNRLNFALKEFGEREGA